MKSIRWRGQTWEQVDGNVDLTPALVVNLPNRKALLRIGRRRRVFRLRSIAGYLLALGFSVAVLIESFGSQTASSFSTASNLGGGSQASIGKPLRHDAAEIISLAAYSASGTPQAAPGLFLPVVAARHEWRPVEISVYSAKYHGRGTASGQRYDHYRGLTAATARAASSRRPALPFGSKWEVQLGKRSVIVTITDTGSYRPRLANKWLDLSGKAWSELTGGKPGSRLVARMRRMK